MTQEYWRQCIKSWYPELLTRSYFLPPLHFNRVPYSEQHVASQTVLVKVDTTDGETPRTSSAANRATPRLTASHPKKQHQRQSLVNPIRVNESDIRDDKAQERVLNSLRVVADNYEPTQVMMVISQLQFGKYLSKPCYAATIAAFPRPLDLPHQYRRGDFDVLIVHREHGLIICEVKSVGANFSDRMIFDEEHKQDVIIANKIKESVKQLKRAEVVLKHLVSDLGAISIRKVIMMPYVKSSQLIRAISKDNMCAQELFDMYEVHESMAAVRMCLNEDHMPPSFYQSTMPNDVTTKLCDWWSNVVANRGSNPGTMTVNLYEQLVARFCGPATTIDIYCIAPPRLEIRTGGDAVSETGERMSRFVLLPEQFNLVSSSLSRVFLAGPPGTGKTVTLILRGLYWLQQGHDVHVVSTWHASRAGSIVVKQQLDKTISGWTSASEAPLTAKVHRHQFDFLTEQTIVETVRGLVRTGNARKEMFVIADEAGPEGKTSFTTFCDLMIQEMPTLGLWAAAVHRRVAPRCLERVTMTTPLRSPPTVIKEVETAWEITKLNLIDKYTAAYFTETEGPPVKFIEHGNDQPGHDTRQPPEECEKCGREVANVLTELQVEVNSEIGRGDRPPVLRYRDVLVLCDSPHDRRVNKYGQVKSAAMGLVLGLRSCDVPVRVVSSDDEFGLRDLVLGSNNVVMVTQTDTVRGLEKKVVFVTIKLDEKDTTVSHPKGHRVSSRILGASRTTSQLVLITWRPVQNAASK